MAARAAHNQLSGILTGSLGADQQRALLRDQIGLKSEIEDLEAQLSRLRASFDGGSEAGSDDDGDGGGGRRDPAAMFAEAAKSDLTQYELDSVYYLLHLLDLTWGMSESDLLKKLKDESISQHLGSLMHMIETAMSVMNPNDPTITIHAWQIPGLLRSPYTSATHTVMTSHFMDPKVAKYKARELYAQSLGLVARGARSRRRSRSKSRSRASKSKRRSKPRSRSRSRSSRRRTHRRTSSKRSRK